MLARNEFAGLIPHTGTMCLLDRVVEWDETQIVMETDSHRSLENPLRANDRLRALHLSEYGAQCMAVHGGLRAQARSGRAQPGMLVSLRAVNLHIDFIDQLAGPLRITAQCDHADATSLQYTFRITHADRLLAEGRAAVVLKSGPTG